MTSKINLPRRSKGKRPTFFENASMDHMVTMILELSTELSVVYSRVDTLERVLEDAKLIKRESLETYSAGQSVESERAEWRALFLDRLLRSIRDAQISSPD